MTSRNNQSGGVLFYILNTVVRKVMSRTIGVERELWKQETERRGKEKATELTKQLNENINAFVAQLQIKYSKEGKEYEEIIKEELQKAEEELQKAELDEDDTVILGPKRREISTRTERKDYAEVANGVNLVVSPGEQPKTLTQEQKEALAVNIERELGIKFTPEQMRQMKFNTLPPRTYGGKKRKTNKKRKLKRRKTRRKH